MICIGDHFYTLQVETPQPSRENYHDRTGGMVLRVGWVKGQLISKCHFGFSNSPKKQTKTFRLELP
jgi:hypothetical protein